VGWKIGSKAGWMCTVFAVERVVQVINDLELTIMTDGIIFGVFIGWHSHSPESYRRAHYI
jgi:hypothetical protein